MTVMKPTPMSQKAFFWLSILTGMMLVLAAGSANDIDHPKWISFANNNNKQIPGRYIIEFNDDYMGTTEQFLNEMEREHQSYRWTMAHDYHSDRHPLSDSIFRGISIHLEEQPGIQAANTAKMSEHQVMRHVMDKHLVKRVFPVFEVPRPKLHRHNILRAQELDISPEVSGLPFSHAMTQVNRVHSELGLDGEGVLVGIIDTGVDYNHPSLGGGFGPGYKVAKGYDLVGDGLDVRNPNSLHPGKTPLDTCAGHGTHVAGIIAAEDKKYNFTGVAPKATLGMWRIFGCHGSTSTDLVIKGMIMAYEAGCNVINLSLGGPNSWPEDPSSVVADRISRRNVTVVVAAGNEGSNGIYMISSPSTGFDTISVASVDNDYSLHPNMYTDNGNHFPYALGSTTDRFPNGTLVAYSNTSDNDHDACEGTEPENELEGAIVLVQRGTCQFDEKANIVAKHGAIGMLVYDSKGEDTFVPSTETAMIPVAAVSHKAGLSLLDDLQMQHKLNLTFALELSRVPVSTAGQVSRFSSLGPTSEMDVKPDIAGVGGYVFSTLPLSQGSYGVLSGTSMASPYIAGVSALYKQAHGLDTSSVVLRQQLQSYAKMTTLKSGELNNPIRQGAGLVQAYDAIQGRLFLNPAKISFNDTIRRSPKTITVTNNHDEPVSYVLKNVPGVSVMPYNVSKQGYAPLQPAQDNTEITATLAFDMDTISLAPGESRDIQLSVNTVTGDMSNYLPFPVYGGSVQLVDASSGHVHAHVPYVGVEGDVSQLPIFGYGFPFLADASQLRKGGLSLGNNPLDKFVLDRTAPPTSANASVFVLSRFITGTAHMVAEVVDENDQVLGIAYQADYLERNIVNESGFININRWNGSYVPTGFETENRFVPVMQGVYHLRWRALKVFADPSLPDSWEQVTSPQILVT